MKKIIFIFIVSGLIFSGVLIVKKRKEVLNSFTSVSEKEVLVDFVKIKKGSLDLKYKTIAELNADEIIKIISRTEGRLEFMEKEKGDRVSKGELLAVLDTKIILQRIEALKGEIEKLKSEADFFQKRYSRNKSLLKGGGISIDEFDKLKSDYEKSLGLLKKADADKKALEKELGFSKIYSPFDGIVIEKKANKSEFIPKATTLYEIENTGKGFYLLVNVPKTFLPFISDNKIILNQNIKEFSTSVLKINPKIENNKETIQLESKRFNSKDFYLPIGTKTSVFLIKKSVSGFVVPMNTILSLKDFDYVFRIKNNNKTEKIKIEILGIEGNQGVIYSNLLDEDDLLVSGYPSFLMTLSRNLEVKPLER
ncbi:MAG: efflux RND transporter periplasmic adaptor subunit [Desulforegulaceae bacterium]|nr:efflux RND transporter periplasmic adaptor subunit [Desulforegulaceae bacterium]